AILDVPEAILDLPEAILDVPEAILCQNENKANSAQLGGAGAWAELGNKKTLIVDTLFSIFNVPNYKFPLWLVELTLDFFSSCISYFTTFPGGCSRGYTGSSRGYTECYRGYTGCSRGYTGCSRGYTGCSRGYTV
ncbi:MAG: hypothetical protein GY737_24945, partial [Desulfobacteraceae bacterium]|nr:hypothetical protein [Desulfobacteraceae bacterium]